jgi:hypothetical protein
MMARQVLLSEIHANMRTTETMTASLIRFSEEVGR